MSLKAAISQIVKKGCGTAEIEWPKGGSILMSKIVLSNVYLFLPHSGDVESDDTQSEISDEYFDSDWTDDDDDELSNHMRFAFF